MGCKQTESKMLLKRECKMCYQLYFLHCIGMQHCVGNWVLVEESSSNNSKFREHGKKYKKDKMQGVSLYPMRWSQDSCTP